jgi:hypothetical protein
MSVKLKHGNRLSGGGANLLLALAVVLVMLLLFLRMVAFVAGHGHHHFGGLPFAAHHAFAYFQWI